MVVGADKAGIRIARMLPHMLRHTCVVWSLAEGVRIEVVSEMIGHTILQMTSDVYGGLVNPHDPVMAQAMARALMVAGQAIQPRPDSETVTPLIARATASSATVSIDPAL